jgi:uncharacterized repeat protein (TIGR01451 family)
MSGNRWSLVVGVACVALLHGPSAASAQAVLGTAQSFAVLGGSAVTNTGPTAVIGDLGVSPGTAVTGFPPGIVTGGTIHVADAVAIQAQSDVTTAYNFLAAQPVTSTLTGIDLGGLTLLPGVYFFSSSAGLTGTLTLDAQGDPNAVFIFQIGSTLTTASNSSVVLINGAQNCNVFWQVGSSATLGTGTVFAGDILALTSISLTTGASVSGRTLARNGSVTLDTNAVTVAHCAAVPPVPPTLSKAFNPATINAGDSSTLTITLSNADTSNATGAAFTDTLPLGVLISTPSITSNSCGGTLTATAGAGTFSLSNGVIPAITGTTAGTCTVVVNVTAASAGIYLNTLPAGALQTSNGPNAAPASATLAVNSSVTLTKSFNPAIINAGGVSTLTITLGNTNGSDATLTAPLTDSLPSGMVIATLPVASTTCGGGLVANANATTVTLQAGNGNAIPANSTCTVTVNVTAAAGASYLNTLPIRALITDKGSNAVPASAALVVNAAPPAPTLSKAFVPATINAGGTSTLTITLINSSTSIAVLTAPFTDNLPSGVVVAATPSASTTCGTLVPPSSGDTAVTLSTGAIPAGSGTTAGSCTVTVDVTATAAGVYVNTIPAGALMTTNGNNAAPASATLAVINTAAVPPTLSKLFSPSSVVQRSDPTLVITLCNPNSSPADLIAPLTDTLPNGVVIAATPNASTTCTGSGAVAATPGGTTVILPATRSIPASDCCTVSVNVMTTRPGLFVNTLPINALQTTNGNNAAAVAATLAAVFAVPMLSGWAMLLLPALLALVGFATMRRQTM